MVPSGAPGHSPPTARLLLTRQGDGKRWGQSARCFSSRLAAHTHPKNQPQLCPEAKGSEHTQKNRPLNSQDAVEGLVEGRVGGRPRRLGPPAVLRVLGAGVERGPHLAVHQDCGRHGRAGSEKVSSQQAGTPAPICCLHTGPTHALVLGSHATHMQWSLLPSPQPWCGSRPTRAACWPAACASCS